MGSRVRIFVAVVCLVIVAPSSVFPMPGRSKDKEQKLIAKIERQKNPGKKARLQIQLARLKLKQADAAYDRRDFTGGKTLLQKYLEQVRSSWATLQGADNAIKKHARAFMALEISLREDDRLLEDLRRSVPYPENEGIKEIEKESGAVHTQVLEALFPGGFSRKKGSKRSMPPKSSVRTKAGAAES